MKELLDKMSEFLDTALDYIIVIIIFFAVLCFSILVNPYFWIILILMLILGRLS